MDWVMRRGKGGRTGMSTIPNEVLDGRETPTVFVDAGPFSYSRLTGLSRYTAQLTLALAGRVPIRFFCEDQEIHPPRNLDWSQDQDLARWSRRIWRGRRTPIGAIPDHSIGLFCTLRPIHRTFPYEVSVLHDFSPYTVPATHLESTRKMFGGFFVRALPVSDLAVAVSESTKADAAWLSPMDPSKIVVAHSGPSLCVGKHGSVRPVQRRSNVGLVVSTLEPRKNARFLFDWFFHSSEVADDSELWWVGPTGWLSSRRELKRLQKPGSGRRIKFLGVVGDAQLCRLYQTAAYSAYPSLYEGFGFPVLDSLRHHTPVLAAQNSSIREFDSPGLFFFDPLDKDTLEGAYKRCHAEAVGRAIPQTPLEQHYSWRNVAQTILDEHRRHLGSRVADQTSTRAA